MRVMARTLDALEREREREREREALLEDIKNKYIVNFIIKNKKCT